MEPTVHSLILTLSSCYNINMSELKTKLRKTQYWLKHDMFVFDNIVIIVAAACCLMWTWGSISAMTRNWTLSQELIERERQKALLELEVETLELENEYYHSNEYKELSARKYQNKKLPGETMIYLPANSEAAKAKHDNINNTDSAVDTPQLANFEQWMAFLFGI